MLLFFSLAQLVTQATRISNNLANILDFVRTTHADLASHITYLPGISDRLSLNFIINAPIPKKSKYQKTIRDYRKANVVALNNELSHFYDDFVKHLDDHSVQPNWDLFACTVHRLTEKYIPNHIITSNVQAPWYSSQLKRLSNRKKHFYHLAKSSPFDVRWAAYKSASDIYIAALKTAKDNYLSSTLPEILKTNLKFWQIINPRTNNAISLEDSSGNAVSENICATILNYSYTSQFSKTGNIELSIACQYEYLPMHPAIVE